MIEHPTQWPNLQPFTSLDLSPISAVYAVIGDNDEVCYVGQTTDIRERWRPGRHHRKDDVALLKNPKLAWLPCPQDCLISLESELIDWLCPSWNGQRGAAAIVQQRFFVDAGQWQRFTQPGDTVTDTFNRIIKVHRAFSQMTAQLDPDPLVALGRLQVILEGA